MVEEDAERRRGFNSKLEVEAESVLKQAVFQRSPVLSKLLRYLLDETVAGRADNLKSFVVAIEGLGRNENFDAASDSSARVQMVRLRKTLEAHYAQHGPVAELCIYLQPGSYTVRLGKLPVAYPMLYRPLSDTNVLPGHSPEMLDDLPIAPAAENGRNYAPAAKIHAGRPNRRNWFVGVGALVGIALIVSFWLGWQDWGPANRDIASPVLELLPVDSGDKPELAQTSRIVLSTFADGLPRFKLSRVRVINSKDDLRQPEKTENVYRLSSRVEHIEEEKMQKLFLNLIDAQTNTSLWSREVDLPNDQPLANALIPLLAEINGPFGAISTHGAMIYKDSKSGGYPCLLRYFSFLKTRDLAIEKQTADCLEKPVDETQLRATLFAARAFFVFENSQNTTSFAEGARKAHQFARSAIAADPNDGSARYAMARMSYLDGDCVTARFYTQQAMDANSNSPIITATLASLAQECGYQESRSLLDHAFMMQGTGNVEARLLLVLGSIGQNRPEKILELQSVNIPQSERLRLNYYLTETLIAASQDNAAKAAGYWKQFSMTLPSEMNTPDEKLRRIILSPAARRKLIGYLSRKGVFGAS